MHVRQYTKGLHELRGTAEAFRLTVRLHRRGMLSCDAWQETVASRRPHVLWEPIDTWVADSPLTVVRSLDDVTALFTEACMQQRLPGLD